MEKLKEIIASRRYMFLGVGNRDRGDDGIGSIIVSKLETRDKLDCGPVPENFTGKIRAADPEAIIIIDAVDFGGKPGESMLTEAEKAQGVVLSTHALPLSMFCKLFPKSKVYLLGIQPQSFTEMTREVKEAGERLVAEIDPLLK